MKELVFKSAQEYLNYDFDDNWCFFFEELQKYGEYNPSDILTDYEGKFAKIIGNLFNLYDSLIINTEEEKLYGVIGKEMFIIKEVKIE